MRRCISCGLIVLSCASISLSAQTIADVPSQYPTITAALASGASVIRVAAGTYNESITVGSVHLIGAGAASTTINGGPFSTVEVNTPFLMQPVIQGFTITGSGHGVLVWGSGSMALVDCVITGTSTPMFAGAGVHMYDEAPTVEIVRCHIHGCSGSAVAGETGHLKVVGCLVEANTGGITGAFYGLTEVSDSLVLNNGGTGISMSWGAVHNSTVVGNNGGVSAIFSNVIRNTVFWNNGGAEIWGPPSSPPQVSYCDVQGGYVGIGNISSDPLFTDALNGDYSLAPGSPCIDAGDPGEVDPDGSRSDIGYRPGLPLLPGFAIQWPSFKVNGGIGGLTRRVDVLSGQPITMHVDYFNTIPESFMVLGFLGVPAFSDQVALPLVGGLAFPPALPGLSTSSSFTLTNNIWADPQALIPSTGAPWSVTFPAGLPSPIQITLQAVTLLASGSLMTSNAVLLNVY